MKKFFSISVLSFVILSGVKAQKSIGIGGLLTTPGYGINLCFNLQSADMSNLKTKLSAISGIIKTDTYNAPVNVFYLDAGYYYNVYKSKTRTFSINVGGSGTAAYEIINSGKPDLENGDILVKTGGIVYGFSIGAESEFYLTDRLSLFAGLDQYYIINSYIGNFMTQASAGVKLYF